MFKSREYIGISLEGEFLKIARIKPRKKGFELVRLDKLKLVNPIVTEKKKDAVGAKEISSEDVFSEEDSDDIFGLELDDDQGDEDIEEIDLDELGGTADMDIEESDLLQESSQVKSNEELLANFLDDFKKNKVTIALNNEMGNTIFQVIRSENFNELKKKEVSQIVLEKLEAIYGSATTDDYYKYIIRKDGSLVLASIDEESPVLQLATKTVEKFNQKFYIHDVYPDELLMAGLFKNHYEKHDQEITGLLQIGPQKCRMVFMKGHEILQVSPVINEGTSDKNFLNTIFSKILFQLDTGEIPGLDRFILFNNAVGENASDFFRKNFPDLQVEDFKFNPELFSFEPAMKETLPGFTTVIGLASAAAGVGKENYPALTFLPKYVSDRQKTFKLHWHGFLLLILIGASPVILNHFYQQNVAEIDRLTFETNTLQSQINELQPLVDEAEELTMRLGQMQSQLQLLGELSEGNIRWSVTLDEFNRAVENVGSTWVNSFRQNNDVIMVDGYSLFRERIPALANRFDSVTLMSVRREEVRERDVFYFTMMIRRVIDDEARFTPDNTRSVNELLN